MNPDSKSRAISRILAVILGIVVGVEFFRIGFQTVFVSTESAGVINGIIGMMSLLPFSILAIFRPRVAAYGILACMAAFLASLLWSLPPSEVLPNLLLVALPTLIAVALLYGSGKSRLPEEPIREPGSILQEGGWISNHAPGLAQTLNSVAAGGKRKTAQWAAATVGIIAGAFLLPSATWGLGLARTAGWSVVAAIVLPTLSLIPLSILGLFKPRMAGYVALVCFGAGAGLFVLISALTRLGLALSLGAFTSYLLVLGFPFALMAGLLLYASGGSGGRSVR